MNINLKCNAIKLNSVALTYGGDSQYPLYVEEFNKYAKNNNIDIELKVIIYTPENSSVTDFGTTIEYLLKRESTKYDIIFYDNVYNAKYSPYFVNLKDFLPKQHIEMYSSGYIPEICKFKDKWVGLPVSIDLDVMYINKVLLDSYNQTIPKTWDELIKTGKIIMEQERQKNTDLIGYNGLFSEDEASFCSAHEFIYSFRKSKEAPFPDYTSQEVIDALNKIKEVMKEVSSNDVFRANSVGSLMAVFSGNALFLKFWYTQGWNPSYEVVPLMGNIEGVSGSSVGGVNIAINKYISEERQKNAAKVVEFLTSKDIQKKLSIVQKKISGIVSLYNDEDVCKAINCELIKSIQPIPRPISTLDDYENVSAEETAYKINNIIKIYSISADPSESKEGFFILMLGILIAITIISLFVFIFKNKYHEYFEFFSKDFWFMIHSGLLISLATKKSIVTITSAMYTNILFVLLLIIINSVNVQNYKVYFIIHSTLFILFVITNYILLYGFRIILIITKTDIKESNYDERVYSVQTSTSTSGKNIGSDSNLSRLRAKIIEYHNSSGNLAPGTKSITKSSNTNIDK
ncbi:periplasmic binding protein-like II [Anaeromyces robustus]|uniref:Periplasmic binding protein-like II n=1 Tax=Anaeromyces robustus TaxID=1754192 RepID=A0A1Y1X227_9FUNG|nr:periplasmic binding protein-like II [Anaeromyces robustus]|eukprot:ORX79715.1 periplasmic binding protein-like II [Anaeromyces robustus]